MRHVRRPTRFALCCLLAAVLTSATSGCGSGTITTSNVPSGKASSPPLEGSPTAAGSSPSEPTFDPSGPNSIVSNLSVPPATSAPTVTIVDVEHSVALAAITPAGGSAFSGPASLWWSSDGVHWREITPPGARKPVAPGIYPIFDAASFLSPKTGWVTTWSITNLAVTIYRTSDSGKTWSAVPAGGRGDHGGDANWIQLLSPTTAFQENVEATASNMSLDITNDAGTSWHTIYTGPPPPAAGELASGPYELPMLFSSATHGFAATEIPPAEGQVAGGFFETSDGAAHWHRLSLPTFAAAGCSFQPNSPSQCLSTLPTFGDAAHGVLATEVLNGSHAAIGFDTTSDDGASWRAAGSVDVQLPRAPAGSYPKSYALVAVPTTTNWWIVSSTGDAVTTKETDDSGQHWSAVTRHDLIGAPTNIWPLDTTHALLGTDITTSEGTTSALYATSDAGHTWHRLFNH